MTETNQQAEIADLRLRLEEAEETIRAIRSGTVDAFVVEAPHGAQVYTLQTADRPYRLLVEEMQQGAITLGDDGTIAYCNRRFADLVGRPLARLMGVAFRDFIPPDALSDYENLLQKGRTAFGQGESHLQNAGGDLVPVFLTLNALPPESGATVGLLVTDLTTQRHHEKLNALLEALREADRRKNEFLAMLAHELRNPLAPIRNAVQVLLLSGGNMAAVRSASEMIERQISQMVRLVDDLLDVSRITQGKIELRKEQIELTSVIKDSIEAVRSLTQSMNHELTVTLPQQPIYLNADPIRLAQVVGNLLNNACKFTQSGGRISVQVEREAEQAVIRIRDTGIGIAAEQLSCIFDMFTQLDVSLGRSLSGLGIGLMLVQKLMELHGGTVNAFSAGQGKGTEFIVRLPIMASTHQPPPPVPAVSEPVPAPVRRILVVDDNRDSATSLVMLLELSGNKMHTAYDGLEAVEVACTFLPHVVLLDIGLPKLNGYEVARKIRDQPWGRDMVLVALTGWGHEEARQKSRDAGFNGHLTKPVDFLCLEKLIAGFASVPWTVSRTALQ